MTNRAKKLIIASVVGAAVCVMLVLGVLAGAAVMGWKSAVRAGNEAATIQNLKTIAALEVQYFNMHHRTFGTLDQLVSEQMLSKKFAGHPTETDGYVFTLSVTRKPDGSSSSYKITADPQDESQGRNHFYFDSNDDRIHVNSQRQAGPEDPLA
jgi:Tfp pilus assembly protein PilE